MKNKLKELLKKHSYLEIIQALGEIAKEDSKFFTARQLLSLDVSDDKLTDWSTVFGSEAKE